MRNIFVVVSILFSSATSFALQCPRGESEGGINVRSNSIDCESGMSAYLFSAATPKGEGRCLVNHSAAQLMVGSAYYVCWKASGENNLTVEVLRATPYQQ
ncbi:MAG: hypothetical protein ACXWQE_04645 [Bdellovibrionales bacterium]